MCHEQEERVAVHKKESAESDSDLISLADKEGAKHVLSNSIWAAALASAAWR
jgi:hypothetical protein